MHTNDKQAHVLVLGPPLQVLSDVNSQIPESFLWRVHLYLRPLYVYLANNSVGY
jgi:hypothetical protein